MSGIVRTDAIRAQMNGLYAHLRRGSTGLFLHDGLIHFGVPPKVVRAYVEATFERQPVWEACCCAWFGEPGVEIARQNRGCLFDRAAKAWRWKLDELARGFSMPAEVAA